MPKKRKAFNKIKQLNRVADHLLKDILICYVDDLEGCVMLDKKRQQIIRPSEAMIASAARPHNWSCTIIALGRNGNEEYFKSSHIKSGAKYYQEDLAPVFESHHLNLTKEMNPNQLCGVAWIASPHGIELSEPEVCDILTKLEAWG